MPIDLTALAQSAIGTAVNGGLNSIGQAIANKNQYKYWERAYDKQRKDALADRAYNENILRNSAGIERNSKVMAGLNPALAQGQVQLAGIDTNSVNGINFGNYNPFGQSRFGDYLSANSLLSSQAANLSADTKKKNAETKKTQTDTEYTNEQLDVYRRTKTALIAQADQTLTNMRLSGQLTKTQAENIKRGFKLLDANTNNVLAQTDRLKKLTPKELSQLDAAIANLKAQTTKTGLESQALKYENVLRSLGIVPGNDVWSNLLGSAMMGKTSEVVTQFISQVFDGFIAGFRSLGDKFKEGTGNSGHPIFSEEGFDENIYNRHKPQRYVRFEKQKNGDVKEVIYWRRYNYKEGRWNNYERAKTQNVRKGIRFPNGLFGTKIVKPGDAVYDWWKKHGGKHYFKYAY